MTILIQNIRNVVSLNTDNTEFDLEINHPEYGWIPYTLSPDDTDTTIDNQALLAMINNGFTGYASLIEAELDTEEAIQICTKRDYLLKTEVDPIITDILLGADMTREQQNAWNEYRVALQNITGQDGFPHNVIWPTKP